MVGEMQSGTKGQAKGKRAALPMHQEEHRDSPDPHSSSPRHHKHCHIMQKETSSDESSSNDEHHGTALQRPAIWCVQSDEESMKEPPEDLLPARPTDHVGVHKFRSCLTI